MTYQFNRAERGGVGIFVGFMGGSRSGKTFSALRLAQGLAGDKRVAAIDTEARRMSHYAEAFDFDVVDMLPPFRPERFAQAAEDAQAAGYGALVIDSFSLEWTGTGGVLDWADRESDRMCNGDEGKRGAVKLASFIKPKMAHKLMRDRLLQLTMPIVFCIRAQEQVEKQGSKIVPVGWTPVQDKSFIYELTVGLTFHPDTPGAIRRDQTHKIQGQHNALFPEGGLVDEAAGAGLRAWAHGTSAASDDAAYRKRRDAADRLLARFAMAETLVELHAITDDTQVRQWRQKRSADDPAIAAEVTEVFDMRAATLADVPDEDGVLPDSEPEPERHPDLHIPGFDPEPAPPTVLDSMIKSLMGTTAMADLDAMTRTKPWGAAVKALNEADRDSLTRATNAARARLAPVRGDLA